MGMTMPEVKYVKGYPPHVREHVSEMTFPLSCCKKDLSEHWCCNAMGVFDTSKDLKNGKHIEDYSSWKFDQDKQTGIDVDFDGTTKTVNRIACYSKGDMRCPPLLGLQDGMSEETIIERFRNYSSNQKFDGVTKKIEYKEIGVWFYLSRMKIYMLGVKDFASFTETKH